MNNQMNHLEIKSITGKAMKVRMIFKGQMYGVAAKIMHDVKDPLVEFSETEHGGVISRYYRTGLENFMGGLNLSGGDWILDSETMGKVIEWVNAQKPEPLFYRGIRSDLPKFDAVEVHPCKQPDPASVEQCAEDDPELSMWSVYLHCVSGGVTCLLDIEGNTPQAKALAELVAESIYKDLDSYQEHDL